jgi:hypothetical protein
MDDQERRERQEYATRKREEAARGQLDKRATELGDELLRPIRMRVNSPHRNGLTATSRTDFHEQMRDVVERGKENELYDRQKGWSKGDQ